MKLLVVEDDIYIRETVQEILESENYTVMSAGNGQEALELLKLFENRPDLILLDLMMPIMDGFEFRKAQLNLPEIAAIPVVIMSADGHIVEKQEKARAFAYLKKPVGIDDLLQAVSKALAAK